MHTSSFSVNEQMFVHLGECHFKEVPATECPANLNDQTAPACTSQMRHRQICEGDNDDLPGTHDDANNCVGSWDVFRCIRGNQMNF